MSDPENFLSRWSRRKREVREKILQDRFTEQGKRYLKELRGQSADDLTRQVRGE